MTTKDMLQTLIKGQEAMQEDIAQLRGEIGGIRGDVSGLRGEVGELRGEIDNVRVDLRGEIDNVRVDLKGEIAVVREEMKKGFKETNARIDKLGKQLAYLEDDTPTREEFEALKK